MRKFLVAATLTAMILVPAAARAGFLIEASAGQGYQVSPKPRGWEPTNLNIAPGFAPSLPVLSMLRFQLGFVTDFGNGDRPNAKTNLELRPMISLVPPILPIYGRVIFLVNNLFDRNGAKREIAYGAAGGVRIGTPAIGVMPAIGVFAEIGVLPRSRDFVNETATGTTSKFAWVTEGRVGAYLDF